MSKKMLVDLQRCVGCWTCAMACKVGNCLEDDEYRVIVRTNGSGAGIDRPQGIYPSLRMSWQPIYQKSCTFCAENVAKGEQQYCVMDCPTHALSWGDDADPESPYSIERQRCLDLHYNLFELPPHEGTRSNVTYAVRE